MWTRAELKKNAKAHLKGYYWQALLVTFMVTCISSGVSSNGGVKISASDLEHMSMELFLTMLPGILMSTAVIMGLSFLITTLFGNMIVVGMKRFFLCARQNKLSISYMFNDFRNGHYLNVLLTMLIKNVKVFLWSLLFIVPGIIKNYEYCMVPYILAENSGIDRAEAFRRSKAMMEGEKWNTFVLQFSFIGWYMLGMLACCLGGLFVQPYQEATMAELYDRLRTKTIPPQPVEPINFYFE